ncbi:RHS repeat protein [Pseudomonas azerbaijanorientalis]|nr:RHS repeat protein [Pseudomonas azerbaijanorientalis]
MEIASVVHRHTPQLSLIDPRGLAVATVVYHQTPDSVTRPSSRTTRQIYSVSEHLVASQDPRLGAEGVGVDAVTRVNSLSGAVLLAQSVDAGWRLSLQDETGQVRQHWDGMGNTSCFEFDGMRRPLNIEQSTAHGPALCIERFYYGSCGPEFSRRNQCGQLIRHADTAGVRAVTYFGLQGAPLEESRRFLSEFEHAGWPANEDEQDALLEPDADKTYSTRWQYSALGESLLQIDAAGHVRRYRHDLAGQLKAAWLVVAGKDERLLVSDQMYNASGKIEQEKAGNGVISMWTYDPADDRMRQLSARKGGRVLQDLRYDYDPVGNVISMDDQSQPVIWFANQRVDPINRYCYDSLYQLISATGREVASVANGPGLPGLISPVDPSRLQNYLQRWSYDAGGNRIEQRHSDRPSHFMDIAPDSNRGLARVEGKEPDFGASFDSNGNLKVLVPGQLMRWTARNQLAEVILVHRPGAENDSERYLYDSAGLRVRKLRTLLAANVTRKVQVRYLPGLEIRTEGADTDDEVLHVITTQAGRSSVRLLHWKEGRPSGISEDQLRYSLDDLLGSSALELDEEADLISYEGYYPYGGTAWWMGRSQVEVKYKFVRYSGKELDATGLYYYGFRYYATWLGRWINPDPAWGVDGLNFYKMVRNNPVVLRDEFGLYSGAGDVDEIAVEQVLGYRILGRGRAQLTPSTNLLLERGLDAAQRVLNQTITELESGSTMDARLDDVYGKGIGIGFKPALINWYKKLRGEFVSYISGSNRDQFVFLDSAQKKNSTLAFVFPQDKHKRVFLTAKAVQDEKKTLNLATTLIHEVSHLVLNTHDFYYYSEAALSKENYHDLLGELKYEAEVASKGLEGSPLDIVRKLTALVADKKISDRELIDIFGTANLSTLARGIETDPQYRSRALFYNADSFSMTAMLVGGGALRNLFRRNSNPMPEPEPDY